ncbi:MAG: metallophosphoesterase family protein [Candidatus Dojkabacteria bacterium]|nr:MAG: metallophosphoesterase family protein [Candidatus Dojkabacteria bacterium]
MKYLVISDTHLTHRFYPDKYEKLRIIIQAADRVIINGDFWDGYFTTFDKFLKSEWKTLFPLLKEKKAVYITGNHDDTQLYQFKDNCGLFADLVAENFKFKSGDKQFYVEHGHRILPEMSRRFMPLRKSRLFLMIWNLPFNIGEYISLKLFRTPAPVSDINQKLFEHFGKDRKGNHYTIVSHSHKQEFNEKAGVINTGYFRWGLAQYLTVEDEKVVLHSENY